MAPGERDLGRAVPAAHHLLLGHGLAVRALRASVGGPVRVGAVVNLSPCEPASDDPRDVVAARRADGHTNRWWLDPLHGRGYPADMVAEYGFEPPVHDGDMDIIATPTDHIGLNYYFRQIITDDPDGPAPRARMVPVPGAFETAMGWEVYPDGLYELLIRLHREYAAPKIYVTENGAAFTDTLTSDGTIEDKERLSYLEEHVAATGRAVRSGAPVAGYFAWSLLDNFEWAYGYDKRFGLVHVDYETQVRTIKASGHRYADMIREQRALG
jgi:beta-glucosidase